MKYILTILTILSCSFAHSQEQNQTLAWYQLQSQEQLKQVPRGELYAANTALGIRVVGNPDSLFFLCTDCVPDNKFVIQGAYGRKYRWLPTGGVDTLYRPNTDSLAYTIYGRRHALLAPSHDYFAIAGTFTPTNGDLTIYRNDGGSFAVNLDGRYLRLSSISATSPILYDNTTGIISHATSGVTPGTYNNVTLNATGHATAASNIAYLTANQSITWTASNDVSGSASGATSISPSLTVTGLRGVALPSLGASAGFLKYTGTGTNTWVFDTNTYLTGNQSITVTASNDVSGSASGTTSISPSLTVTGIRNKTVPTLAAGNLKYDGANWTFDNTTYLTGNQSITVTASNDVSGSASGTTSISPSLTVTGLRGVALPSLGASAGFLKYTGTGTNTWVFDTNTYLTGNQSITWTGSGDVSGSASGSTSISPALTLATVNGNVGTIGDGTHTLQLTLDAKGRTTAATAVAITFPVTTRDRFGYPAEDIIFNEARGVNGNHNPLLIDTLSRLSLTAATATKTTVFIEGKDSLYHAVYAGLSTATFLQKSDTILTRVYTGTSTSTYLLTNALQRISVFSGLSTSTTSWTKDSITLDAPNYKVKNLANNSSSSMIMVVQDPSTKLLYTQAVPVVPADAYVQQSGSGFSGGTLTLHRTDGADITISGWDSRYLTSIPNLQQVTDQGAGTTNNITITNASAALNLSGFGSSYKNSLSARSPGSDIISYLPNVGGNTLLRSVNGVTAGNDGDVALATPTWQQTLIAGSTFTQANTITQNSYPITFNANSNTYFTIDPQYVESMAKISSTRYAFIGANVAGVNTTVQLDSRDGSNWMELLMVANFHKFQFSGGTQQWNLYGSGSNTGTPTYNLSVDASGNVLESAIPTTPTWQQTLTAGSSLTGNNTVHGESYSFTWLNDAIQIWGGTAGGNYSSFLQAVASAARLNSQTTTAFVDAQVSANNGSGSTTPYVELYAENGAGNKNTVRINYNSMNISILGTGALYSNSGDLTNTNPSDMRLKNSISDFPYGLNEVLQLDPKQYYYNSDSLHKDLSGGFIAQQMREVMPLLVREDRKGYLGIKSDMLMPAFVNAFKQMQQEIEDQGEEIKVLKQLIKKSLIQNGD